MIQQGPISFRFSKNSSRAELVAPKMRSIEEVPLSHRVGLGTPCLAEYTTLRYSVSSRGISPCSNAYFLCTGLHLNPPPTVFGMIDGTSILVRSWYTSCMPARIFFPRYCVIKLRLLCYKVNVIICPVGKCVSQSISQ